MGSDLGKGLRQQLRRTMEGGHAHATFEAAVADLPVSLRGKVVEHLPYSAWQILEHIRIAQLDILEFSDNAQGRYKPIKWPDAYWPVSPQPANESAWDDSVSRVLSDRQRFVALIEATSDEELVKPFPWGDGQTLLHEALLLVDHAGYHIGELIVLRRLLGAWK